MGLLNDPDMCRVCETRNCQHPDHHEPSWVAATASNR